MEKTFTYEFLTNSYYLESSDENEYDFETYEFCPSEKDLKDCIVDLVEGFYFEERFYNDFEYTQRIAIRDFLIRFIDDNDLWEDLSDSFNDELKDCFLDDAFKEYKERG
jgi:hypothetical protein